MQKYYLGIDIGTTFLKVAIYDLKEMKCLAAVSYQLELISNNDYELFQYPNIYYDKTVEGIKECIKIAGIDSKSIGAIALDGQMGGIMGIDHSFNPVTNYDILNDRKAIKYSDLLNIENADLIYENVGCLSTYGGKILYLLNNKKLSKKIKKFVQPAGFVAGKLCNLNYENAFMDYTYLCWSGLADYNNLDWSKFLCEKFEVSQDTLPRIVDPFEIIGYVSKSASRDCNLREGTPVAAGAGDGITTLFGAGINYTNQIAILIGSAVGIFFSRKDITFMDDYKYPNMYSVFKDLKFIQNWDFSGRSHFWFIEKFFNDKDRKNILADMDKDAENIEPGSGKLFFIPYFNGIIQPYKPFYKGAWLGLNFSHNKVNLYRSILESIAYSRYNDYVNIKNFLKLKNNEINSMAILGGGARSNLWAQIFSDLFDLKIIRYNHNDFAALGSATIAAKSINEIDDPRELIDSYNQVEKIFNPEKAKSGVYKKFAYLYKDMVNNLENFYKKLDSL